MVLIGVAYVAGILQILCSFTTTAELDAQFPQVNSTERPQAVIEAMGTGEPAEKLSFNASAKAAGRQGRLACSQLLCSLDSLKDVLKE